MLKFCLSKILTKVLYPTKSFNWYINKGYTGKNLHQQFIDFINKQSLEGAQYFKEFRFLNLTRQFIPSIKGNLDSVIITPDSTIIANKPGKGVYFILFQGTGEYYESKFRDMAKQSISTGASVIGFNPKGFGSSSGNTNGFLDLVDDGISVVRHLLNKGILHKNIVLQGNSLGSSVQEIVSEYFKLNHKIYFRQINSNSFKDLPTVLSQYYKMPFLNHFLKKLLNYSGWRISYGLSCYKTGVYKMYLRRKNDRTITEIAEFHSAVNHKEDYESSPEGYRETNKWLNKNNQVHYNGAKKDDPHKLHLFSFRINEKGHPSVFYMINKYLEHSKKYM